MTQTLAYDVRVPAPATSPARPVAVRSQQLVAARLATHLCLASLPVLGISAQVFGWIGLHALAIDVLLPLALLVALLAALAPHRIDRFVATALGWGVLACAAYDAFRLPTIYVAHWWGDFFGSVGGWAVAGHGTNFAVGYVWRYLGDGGGIAVPFFVVMALVPPTAIGTVRRSIAAGVAYGVFPVWSGLIITDALAPAGHQLFALTPTTFLLSLVGHLLYGSGLGLGWWQSRRYGAGVRASLLGERDHLRGVPRQ